MKISWLSLLFLGLCVACSSDNGDGSGSSEKDVSERQADGTQNVPEITLPDNGNQVDGIDTNEPVEGLEDLGNPCAENSDCESGFCVEGPSGSICTQSCLEECPAGFLCKGVQNTGSDLLFLCVPLGGTLCAPCTVDLQCNGGRCADFKDGGGCTTECDTVDDCPKGYECTEIASQAGDAAFQGCKPPNETCSCNVGTEGLIRSCEAINEYGSCLGFETCDAVDGWVGCDAPTPAAELCDGKDNDCNGLIDDKLVESECSNSTDEVGTCTGMNVCAGKDGWVCQAPIPEAELCDYLDNDCDGEVDEDFKVNGLYGTTDHCGKCGKGCVISEQANGSALCVPEVPTCKMECNDGFFDVNNNPTDGCECEWKSETDAPYGGDSDCDGVDGELGNAIFVSKAGDDGNPGTYGTPVFSITKGIELAKASGARDVYVATGVYVESLSLVSNVAIYGGYSADFVSHEPAVYETAIMGLSPTEALPGAVNAVAVTGKAGSSGIDGFTIFGADGEAWGESSYGVYLRDTGDTVAVTNNVIVAGSGAPGADGKAGIHGSIGKSGAPGIKAKDIGTVNCSKVHHQAGGAGGNNSCTGANVGGGNGGTAVCPDFDQSGSQPASNPYTQTTEPKEWGKDGKNNSGANGKGGSCGYDSVILKNPTCGLCNIPPNSKEAVGSNGAHGSIGTSGKSGAACTASSGYVENGLWHPHKGGLGAPGNHGGGGGGGGAAGGVETDNCQSSVHKFDDVGGSGGGAGAGGCGGTGGSAGSGGGGAFAIFVTYSNVATSLPGISNNTLKRGWGGHGGHGDPGGVGGDGGSGANGGIGGAQGGTITFCVQQGGTGGDGGNGGHGAGGGGGCGGVSFGIYLYGQGALDISALKTANTVQMNGGGGKTGPGGFSLGNPGGDGSKGTDSAFNF